jgi:excisionase family DNA binding protein
MPRKNPPETPLYVRLPSAAVEKLDRAADALGMHKKDLVAGLVTKYVDPGDQRSLAALGSMVAPRPTFASSDGGTTFGSYSFRAYEAPEIMNAEQAGQFLQLDEKTVLQLAEAGELPGKRLGEVWRFSREGLVSWLSAPTGGKSR